MTIKHLPIIFAAWASLIPSCAADDRNYWPTEEWRVSEPQEQGFDSNKLAALSSYIRKNLPKITSLLIIRHGYVVFEQYYQGDRDTLRRLYSIPKTYISCLIGLLIKQGYLKSVDEKMISFFPEFQGPDTHPDVNRIALRHLLTMSDGLNSSFFSKYVVTQPLRNEPGKDFFYNEMSPQILSMIITKATGLKALDFAKKYLFEPLGISNISWSEMANYTNGADGLSLTTRDDAKLGYLYLNNGIWNGEQIVPSSWVTESTSKQIDITDESRGWTREYGFYWWLRDTVGYHSYIAAGWGPQLVYVVPELDLLIVLTTNDYLFPGPPYLPFIDLQIVRAIND